MTTALSGMNAIQDYCRSIQLASSAASLMQMIRDCGFPARKLGGIWESDKEEITIWRRKYIRGEIVTTANEPIRHAEEPPLNTRRKAKTDRNGRDG